jgi:hypothetical protein
VILIVGFNPIFFDVSQPQSHLAFDVALNARDAPTLENEPI